jgi:hypothetical protein
MHLRSSKSAKRFVTILVVLFVFGSFAWAADMPRNDSIIIGESHNFRGMDPAQMISSQESSLGNTIYEGLTAYNKDNPGQPLPDRKSVV